METTTHASFIAPPVSTIGETYCLVIRLASQNLPTSQFSAPASVTILPTNSSTIPSLSIGSWDVVIWHFLSYCSILLCLNCLYYEVSRWEQSFWSWWTQLPICQDLLEHLGAGCFKSFLVFSSSLWNSIIVSPNPFLPWFPKLSLPSSIDHYWLISLLSCAHKLGANVLGSRLALMIHNIVASS